MQNDSKHTHTVAEAPTAGKEYQCLLNGMPLYDACVKNVTGCWATVEVVHPHPGPHEHNYRSGQTFDIRISSYTFQEKSVITFEEKTKAVVVSNNHRFVVPGRCLDFHGAFFNISRGTRNPPPTLCHFR